MSEEGTPRRWQIVADVDDDSDDGQWLYTVGIGGPVFQTLRKATSALELALQESHL